MAAPHEPLPRRFMRVCDVGGQIAAPGFAAMRFSERWSARAESYCAADSERSPGVGGCPTARS